MKELVKYAINKTYNTQNNVIHDLLRENNLNEDQWNSFVNLADDLDLNSQGASILLEEIKSGRVLLG